MAALGLDPHRIDHMVISHDHVDHTGGADSIMVKNPGMGVCLIPSFTSGLKKTAKENGALLKQIRLPEMVTANCFSTGQMRSLRANEQGLVIMTDRGLIVITGCAHPGILNIVEQVKRICPEEILLVMGGFHLLETLPPKIKKIAEKLKAAGVKYVAPSHCSGSDTSQIFADAFGDRYIESGLGRTITADDLKV